MTLSPLQSIDLFAGCGGLSTGLHQAGWKGLFAVGRNEAAFSTLKANLVENRKHFTWPAWLPVTHWDIKTLLAGKSAELAKLKGSVDLVVGGPPCQGFSTAGRRVEGDQRNQLVRSDLRQCHGTRPCPDSRGFSSGITARSGSGLQKHLRQTHSPHIPDSHRFVNHTGEVEEVFARLLAEAPRNRCIMGAAREPFGLKKRSGTVLDGHQPAPTVTTSHKCLVVVVHNQFHTSALAA